MSELPENLRQYDLPSEWPHIKALRAKLLADIAIAQALREGYSHTGDLEIEVEENN